jgi:hypothetical protein
MSRYSYFKISTLNTKRISEELCALRDLPGPPMNAYIDALGMAGTGCGKFCCRLIPVKN